MQKEKHKVVDSKQTIKTVVTIDVYNKMKYLCQKISAVEWSGVLFYTVEGSIKDPENMVITMRNILPLDKGTSGYTEYVLDDRLTNFLMDNPDHLGYKIGHIHSHNTMAVFFSGTDMDELTENSEAHNYYFSFIVNNKMEMTAKVGQMVTSESKSYVKALDDNGEEYISESLETSKHVITYDCKIHNTYVSVTDDVFKANVEEIMKPKPAPTPKFGMGYQKQHSLFDDFEKANTITDYGPGFSWSPNEVDGDAVDAEELCIRLLTKQRVGNVTDKVTLEAIIKEKNKTSLSIKEAVNYFFLNLDVFIRDVTKIPVEEEDMNAYIDDLLFIRDTIDVYDEYKLVQEIVVSLEDIIEQIYKEVK
tara:strand:+ start:423 stop:1508 length:1086 start_codon:yes stop_codon:yes gene_type:complete